jgi:hypothetical protein
MTTIQGSNHQWLDLEVTDHNAQPKTINTGKFQMKIIFPSATKFRVQQSDLCSIIEY